MFTFTDEQLATFHSAVEAGHLNEDGLGFGCRNTICTTCIWLKFCTELPHTSTLYPIYLDEQDRLTKLTQTNPELFI